MLIKLNVNFCYRAFAFYQKYYRFKLLRKMSSFSAVVKPPNVLVFTAEKMYKHAAENLGKCLCIDKYLIYHLKQDQVLTTPWMENAVLLVVISDDIEENIVKEFIQFVKKGGKLLAVSSNIKVPGICSYECIEEKIVSVTYKGLANADLYRGKYMFSTENGCVLAHDDKNKPVIFEVKLSDGTIIISSVYLGFNISASGTEKRIENSEANLSVLKSILSEKLNLEGHISDIPAPSCGYVIVEKDAQIEDMMKFMSISEISLEKSIKSSAEKGQSSDIKVPLLFHYDDLKPSLFDKSAYFSALRTSYFGKPVVFFPVVTSTMYPAEHLSNHPGIVVIANRQISGKGRGENMWISPEGAAAFTLHFPLMLSSKLGQRMSLMQHMASLALVHGLRKKDGYENLEFRLKWPNDIFYEADKKIGGVLVNTTIQGDVVHTYIGIGLNVANVHPSVCVNSVIKDFNVKHGKSLKPLKVEEVIASTLNELETLVNDFTDSGIARFLDLYYKYWIHQDQSITLAGTNVKAIVKSIDEYGFLIVETEDGKKLSLQPDGNRFDIMKNLIVAKEIHL